MKHAQPLSTRIFLAALVTLSTCPAYSEGSGPAVEQLGEITVTATRREESLSSVPISVSAFDQATMDAQQVRQIGDIARLTPGLTLRPTYAGTTGVSIRGISSSVGAATTGIYLDDTPIQVRAIGDANASTNVYPTVFDLERVEVLRGPQGTLFGAGSEGGTVRFISPQPNLKSYDGYARSSLGVVDGGATSYEAGVAVGGPMVVDKAGFRASAYFQREGGWIDRVDPVTGNTVQENTNSGRSFVGRLALAFAPNDALRITPSIYYMNSLRHDESRYWENLSNPDSGVFKSANPGTSPYAERFTLPSLAVEWQLSSATFFSNTSYFDRKLDNDFDISVQATAILTNIFTGHPMPFLPGLEHFSAHAGYHGEQDVFTQEMRLQSNDTARPVSWSVGAFYQKARQRFTGANRGPFDGWFSALLGVPVTTQDILGIPLYADDVILSNDSRSWDEQTAVFGEIRYRFFDKLSATAGLRYSHARFDFTNAADGAFNGGPSFSSGSQNENPVTPKFGLEYTPADGALYYLSAAKGFRTGGANAEVPLARCAGDLQTLGLDGTPRAYKSDHVWSYEVGAKNRFADGRLRTAASAFYIKWTDIQQSVFLPVCTYQFIANLGAAVSKGVDLELQAQLFGHLSLNLAVGYNDAQYSERVTAGGSNSPGAPTFISDGDRLPVSEWSVALSPVLDFTLPGGRNGYLRVDYTYNGGYPTFPAAPAVGFKPDGRVQRATRLVNLRGGVRWGGWDISLFAQNLLNSVDPIAFTNDTINSPLFRGTTFRPRTIGAEASFHF